MAYGNFKDLTRKTASDKVLRDKAHNVAKNLKDHEYQRGIAAMVYRFFDRKISGSDNKNENISNQEIAVELHTPIVKKYKKQKVYSSFIDNIQGADLADMQLIINFNKGIYFLLCVIDFFSGHTYVIPLKVKKGITITNAFQKVLDESNRKANKICVDKGSEFYNRLMKP